MAAVLGLTLYGRVDAGFITYHADLEVAVLPGAMGSEMTFGDVFYLQFTIDDTATDVLSDQDAGKFAGMVDFLLARNPSNVGTWDPGQMGSWSLPSEFSTFETGAFNVQTTAEAASAFQPVTIGVNQFDMPFLQLQFVATVNDTGFGQTWAQQVLSFGPVYTAVLG